MAPWDNWGQDNSILPRDGDSFGVLHGLFTLLHSAVMYLKDAALPQADQGTQQQQQQQSPWWQLWKAAASTYASWTKAYVKTLRAVVRGRAAGAAQQSQPDNNPAQEVAIAEGAVRGAAAGWVVSHHDKELLILLSQLSKVPSPVGQAIISPAAVAADRVRLELLLLLWVARLVAATVEHLLPGPTAAIGSVDRREANLNLRSIEGTSSESNSGSSSSSTSIKCVGVGTIPGKSGFASSSSGNSNVVEEGVGASPAAPRRAGHAVMKPGSSAVEGGVPRSLDAALKLALAFYDGVQAWTKCAAEVAAAAAAAGKEAAVPSAPEPLDNKERLLSQRLVHVPISLPAPVASHLEDIRRTCVEKMHDMDEKQLAGESRQWKLQLLQELLHLCQLLLAEVPCTIGCSNPACVDLRGDSEVKVSCKACTGCKVVYYCSRECQVAHWKVHRGICKKLSGSNPGGSESKKGGGKQGAAGKVAASK